MDLFTYPQICLSRNVSNTNLWVLFYFDILTSVSQLLLYENIMCTIRVRLKHLGIIIGVTFEKLTKVCSGLI